MAGTVLVDRVQTNLTGYTVQEDATPLDPSDTTGGVGQIDFDAELIDGPEGSIQLQGLDVELRDVFRGSTFGTITDATLSDSQTVSLTANGRLGALVGTVTAKPMVDTLQNVVMYYLSLAGITDGIIIDPDIAFTPVAVPGFNDDLWLRTKQLVSVSEAEITLVNNKVVVRPLRSFESDTTKKSSISWSISKGDAAQNVEVTYYGNTWLSDTVVYPYTKDERDNAATWQVDPGAVIEEDITTSVSLARVDQPQAVDDVEQDYGEIPDDADGTKTTRVQANRSVYTIYDADNNPITAANWRLNGGKIEVTIADDTMGFHVKVTGATGVGNGPYRIVGRTEPSSVHSVEESKTETDYGKKNTSKDNKTTTTITGINTEVSDDSEDYPSFFLAGDGVLAVPQVLTLPTGVMPSMTVNEVGTTVQVPTVATLAQAYDIGVRVAGDWVGLNLTLSGELTSISQINSTGVVKTRSINEFNADYLGQTFAQFNTVWAGKTIADFNASELAKVEDDFANQVFGNVAGARLKYGDAKYRINSATITDESISFQAKMDTTIDDFNDAAAGLTFAQFNDRFTGKSFNQFNRVPLSKMLSTGTIYVPPVAEAPYPNTFYPDTLFPGADPVDVARVDSARVGISILG
jgi:hypothetical protein